MQFISLPIPKPNLDKLSVLLVTVHNWECGIQQMASNCKPIPNSTQFGSVKNPLLYSTKSYNIGNWRICNISCASLIKMIFQYDGRISNKTGLFPLKQAAAFSWHKVNLKPNTISKALIKHHQHKLIQP